MHPIHHHGDFVITHRMSTSPEWLAWRNARARCTNPSHQAWHNYGGRGIKFAPEWEDFRAFYDDVGPRPGPGYELDRIENDGHYEPGNVRWATRLTNNQNRRVDTPIIRRFLKEHGHTCIKVFAKAHGVTYDEARQRILSGYPFGLVTAPREVFSLEMRRRQSRTATVRFTSDGRSIKEACAASGIKLSCAYKRINRYGWSVDRACTIPPSHHHTFTISEIT